MFTVFIIFKSFDHGKVCNYLKFNVEENDVEKSGVGGKSDLLTQMVVWKGSFNNKFGIFAQ